MTISDKDYNEILAEIGYPVVRAGDLEYTKEQIEDLFIYPALREFFIWFPKTQQQSVYVSSEFLLLLPPWARNLPACAKHHRSKP